MNNQSKINNRLLRAKDIAVVLDISMAQAYRLLQTGKIPTVRINRSVRVQQTDLVEFIRQNYDGGNKVELNKLQDTQPSLDR